VITEVTPGSPAERTELRPGEVILEVDRKPVATADEAMVALRQARGRSHLLRVRGSQGSRFVTIGGG
jgi:serine protease Do